MIHKERNPQEHPAPRDAISRAGVEAERQLAFYLRRAFGETPDIGVFNDLRIADDRGEIAQLDHLVMHPLGFVVVESKSVTGRVRINARGEWARQIGAREQGMHDALAQARLQRDVLKRLLAGHADGLRRGVAGGFSSVGWDVLVAIGDKGVIEREGRKWEKVVKADQVPEAIRRIIRQRKALLEKDPKREAVVSKPEREALVRFLLASHEPRRRMAAPARAQAEGAGAAVQGGAGHSSWGATKAQSRAPRPATAKAAGSNGTVHHCPHCSAARLEMKWGVRPPGYYFRCLACDRNWKPDRTCPSCGQNDVPLRKSKDAFLQECAQCGLSRVFHVNRG